MYERKGARSIPFFGAVEEIPDPELRECSRIKILKRRLRRAAWWAGVRRAPDVPGKLPGEEVVGCPQGVHRKCRKGRSSTRFSTTWPLRFAERPRSSGRQISFPDEVGSADYRAIAGSCTDLPDLKAS